jgi:hypothetical protein
VAGTAASTSCSAPSGAPPPQPPPDVAGAATRSAAFKRQREVHGVLRTYKIRMVVTPEQRDELKLAFSAARHAYNWAVGCINAGARTNFGELRKIYRTEPVPPWARKPDGGSLVHDKIIARAIKQAWDAYNTNIKKWRKNKSHHFRLSFRSFKKSYTETLVLEGNPTGGNSSPLLGYEPAASTHRDGRAECLVRLGGNLSRAGPYRLQDKQRVIDQLVEEENRPREDCKILWDKRTRDFHLVYTFDMPVREDADPGFATKRIVAGDAGQRNFVRFGSPTDDKHGELLVGFNDEIYARCRGLDNLQSRVDRRGKNRTRAATSSSSTKSRGARKHYETTRRLRRKLARDRRRLHNWVEGAHYDAANFLLRRYDVVILPKLSTGTMVAKDSRVFGSQVARSMCTMSHGLFSARATSAAAKYRGRHVIADSGEPGTSGTCSNCGFWDAALGKSKDYHCPRCQIHIDRDDNGWRGNLFAAYGKAVGVGWDGQSG